ncbi:hypothetical protein N9M79_02800 [Alphaproteobacteria bacterium]|nr:hypothetical protein [Alphaproteobacteria bacterium]
MASRNSLNTDIIKVQKGLAIYKVNSSPYYQARVWVEKTNGYKNKSTREKVRDKAIKRAKEIYYEFNSALFQIAEKSKSFSTYATELIEDEKVRGAAGDISPRLWKNTKYYLFHKDFGSAEYFQNYDIREFTTADYVKFITKVRKERPELRPSTLNHIASATSKVLKCARNIGAIDNAPDIPRVKREDNPRPYFKFYPIVEQKNDEYKKLLSTIKAHSGELKIRGWEVDEELYDLVLFLTHSFLRPTSSEVYGLKHRDINIIEKPRTLQITLQGKTGFRTSNTMPAAVSVYERLKKRHGKAKPDDYVFYPQHKNRGSASRAIQRLFFEIVKLAGLEKDKDSGLGHSLYSLRHTAISMRIVHGGGEVDIFTLAKNAGTSVDQIERFYARKLPLSKERIENLQYFKSIN